MTTKQQWAGATARWATVLASVLVLAAGCEQTVDDDEAMGVDHDLDSDAGFAPTANHAPMNAIRLPSLIERSAMRLPAVDMPPVLPANVELATACTPVTPTSIPATPWQTPRPLVQNTCSAQHAATIVSCWFQGGAACSQPVSSACYSCAITTQTAPMGGPLIYRNSSQPLWLNVAGCVARMSGDLTASGCGGKVLALSDCRAAACGHCGVNTADFDACAAQADTTVCAAQATNAVCAAPYLPTCAAGGTTIEKANNLVGVFCGPPLPDGGVPTPPSSDAGSPPACGPQTPTSITPTPWQPPTALHQNKCYPVDAANIATCHLQGGSACSQPVSALCYGCAVSARTAPSAGPLITNGGGQPASINVPGCVARMTGDLTATGCGAKLLALWDCRAAACNQCGTSTSSGFATCAAQADTTVCATQAAAAACATPHLATCASGTTPVQQGYNLIGLFCGP